MALGLKKITKESNQAIDRRHFPHLKGSRLFIEVTPNDKLPPEFRSLLKNGGVIVAQETRITPERVKLAKDNPENVFIDYERRKVYHIILKCGPTYGLAIAVLLDMGLVGANLEPVTD